MLLLLILPATLSTNHSKHVETSYIVLKLTFSVHNISWHLVLQFVISVANTKCKKQYTCVAKSCSHGCPLVFFYWRNFRRIFFTSDLFLAKFGLKKNIIVAKKSSILTIFHPFEPIFIHFQGFHPTSGWIGFRICFSGATWAKNKKS
jgi:hypothetical protein